MPVGNYLASAMNDLQGRTDKQANDIVAGGGGRYSYDNAGQAEGDPGRFLTADRERLSQLGILRDKFNDPTLMNGINNQAETARVAADTSSGSQYRKATGMLRTSLSKRGVVGSSLDTQQTAQNDARLASAQSQAKTYADEIRAAGITGLEGMEKNLTQQILGEDDGGASDTTLQIHNTGASAATLQQQLDAQYGGLLANSLAGVVNNTVTPFITGGYDRQDRLNSQSDNAYQEQLAGWDGQGARPTRGQRANWWGIN